MLAVPSIKSVPLAIPAPVVMPGTFGRQLRQMAEVALAFEKPDTVLGSTLAQAVDAAEGLLIPRLPLGDHARLQVDARFDNGYQVLMELGAWYPLELDFVGAYKILHPKEYQVIRNVVAGLFMCPSTTSLDVYDMAYERFQEEIDAAENPQAKEDYKGALRNIEVETYFFESHFPEIFTRRKETDWELGSARWAEAMARQVKGAHLPADKKKWLRQAVRCACWWHNAIFTPPLFPVAWNGGEEGRPPFGEGFVLCKNFSTVLYEDFEQSQNDHWGNEGSPLILGEPQTKEDFETLKTVAREILALQELFYDGGEIWKPRRNSKRKAR